MTDKLLTEHHLEFLRLKGGCTGPSESTHVKMPHCWKSNVTAQIIIPKGIITIKLMNCIHCLQYHECDCVFMFFSSAALLSFSMKNKIPLNYMIVEVGYKIIILLLTLKAPRRKCI